MVGCAVFYGNFVALLLGIGVFACCGWSAKANRLKFIVVVAMCREKFKGVGSCRSTERQTDHFCQLVWVLRSICFPSTAPASTCLLSDMWCVAGRWQKLYLRCTLKCFDIMQSSVLIEIMTT